MVPMVLPVWLRALLTVVALLAMGVLLNRWEYWLGPVLPVTWLGLLVLTGLVAWIVTGKRARI